MPAWNTPVRDFNVRMPKDLKNASRSKFVHQVNQRTGRGWIGPQKAIQTVQQGVSAFSKKKKNGCKLVSSAEIARAARRAVAGSTCCAAVFPQVLRGKV